MSDRVNVYVRPVCGSGVCKNEDPEHVHGALIVSRLELNGHELAFTEASISADAGELLAVTVKLYAGRISIEEVVE